MEAVERAESKPFVLATAARIGLSVPRFTQDAFSPLSKISFSNMYRKSLGPPFTISFNREKALEVGITVSNSLVDNTAASATDQPWQWQEFVDSSLQVRCFVIGDRIWAACRDRTGHVMGIDYRYLNEITEEDIIWKAYQLPAHTAERLITLMRTLNLTSASPEFLLRKKDMAHVLIDLNPCGDWFGYFSDAIHAEITASIATLLATTHAANMA